MPEEKKQEQPQTPPAQSPKPEKKPEEETEGGTDTGTPSSLISPEAILMFLIAGTLDFIGFVIAVLGTWFAIDDYGILDFAGLMTIGVWGFFKSGAIPTKKGGKGGKGGQDAVKGAAKKSLKRIGLAWLIEMVPFLGGIAPSWVILVYSQLKGKKPSPGKEKEAKPSAEKEEKAKPSAEKK